MADSHACKLYGAGEAGDVGWGLELDARLADRRHLLLLPRRRANRPPKPAPNATAPTATAPAPRPAAPLPRRPAAVDGGRPPPLPLVLSSDSNYSATDFATPEEKSAQRGFLFIHLHKAT